MDIEVMGKKGCLAVHDFFYLCVEMRMIALIFLLITDHLKLSFKIELFHKSKCIAIVIKHKIL